MFNGLVASTFGVVFGRLLPFLWRARRWRVPCKNKFSHGMCVNFRIWPVCARGPTNPENEMKQVSQKAKTRSEQRTRKEPEQTFKNHHFWSRKLSKIDPRHPQSNPGSV
jgi:hypothetical protein